ncbi:MAG: hypothetical protein LQ338_003167 [Usnochroma carphineum]|nr:MAG: hypothetical protein LQ338_003167 [Usnochroma carphineum]
MAQRPTPDRPASPSSRDLYAGFRPYLQYVEPPTTTSAPFSSSSAALPNLNRPLTNPYPLSNDPFGRFNRPLTPPNNPPVYNVVGTMPVTTRAAAALARGGEDPPQQQLTASHALPNNAPVSNTDDTMQPTTRADATLPRGAENLPQQQLTASHRLPNNPPVYNALDTMPATTGAAALQASFRGGQNLAYPQQLNAPHAFSSVPLSTTSAHPSTASAPSSIPPPTYPTHNIHHPLPATFPAPANLSPRCNTNCTTCRPWCPLDCPEHCSPQIHIQQYRSDQRPPKIIHVILFPGEVLPPQFLCDDDFCPLMEHHAAGMYALRHGQFGGILRGPPVPVEDAMVAMESGKGTEGDRVLVEGFGRVHGDVKFAVKEFKEEVEGWMPLGMFY